MPPIRQGNRSERRGLSGRTIRAAQRVRDSLRRPTTRPIPIALSNSRDVMRNDIGDMNVQCHQCNALHFASEKIGNHFSSCCHNGKVSLAPTQYSPLLKGLITNSHQYSKHFLENIRQYNSTLSFTSVGADFKLPEGHGPYNLQIQGQVYHRISDALPVPGVTPKFGQLYFLDTSEAHQHRMNRNDNLKPELMTLICDEITQINPYNALYKQMKTVLEEQIREAEQANTSIPLVGIYFNHEPRDQQMHTRRANLPIASEVAAVFVSRDGAPPSGRCVAVYPNTNAQQYPIRTLDYTSQFLDPLSYVIVWPHGEQGWNIQMTHNSERASRTRNKLTLQEYVCYLLAVRESFSPIHYLGKLFQQLLVDYYCRIEGLRFAWARNNQSQLRVESYVGLADALANHVDSENLRAGKVFILPSSFTGSPRNMLQHYQDAMALVRSFGRPDLFITFTCNGNWREIRENIHSWQRPEDRPDVVVRVFKAKVDEFLNLITKKHIFGKVLCYVYVIEFQKRGLPHVHFLATLEEGSKLREIEDVDKAVCAEIPDANEDPILYDLVKKHMIHGPCGELNRDCVCMVDGKCSKKFPKSFRQSTLMEQNGYPNYMRRDNNRFVTKTVKGNPVELDNRFVVPYNAFLLKYFQAHINVELCSSVKSVKYLHKYVYKGHDAASIRINVNQGVANYDEITSYQSTRYVGPSEAVYRILEYSMHGISHWIIKLDVHLPDHQQVYFREGTEEARRALQATRDSTLTGWFKLNQVDPEARALLYTETPTHYTWSATGKQWNKRQRGGDKVISRLYTVSPKDSERFHLRLLLLTVRGKTSFNDILTVNRTTHTTFKSAADALGLLADDMEWERTLEEMSTFSMPRQLRHMFAYICAFEQPKNALNLWERFKDLLSEDFAHQSDVGFYESALADICSIIQNHGVSLQSLGLPVVSSVVQSGLSTSRQYSSELGIQMKANANSTQLAIIEEILLAIHASNSAQSNAFFVDGPGGSGKTYLYQCLIHLLQGDGHCVIPVAWTGIAAMLLPGGRTVHNRFKFPLNMTDETTSSISYQSNDAQLFRNCKLIIWDEAPMASGAALQAVDRFLRFITGIDQLFGGKVVVLGGDFRQVLPVVPRGSRASTVLNSIKSSYLWPQIQVRHLTVNMRALPEEDDFISYLLSIGNATHPTLPETDLIRIPDSTISTDIITSTFGTDFSEVALRQNSGRAILAPKNDHCDHINNVVLAKLEGEQKDYFSIDSVESDDPNDVMRYPTEFLNSLNVSGLPPHKLSLKRGAVVILLRNLNVSNGLMNGTRLQVVWMRENCLDLQVLSGSASGDRVFLPRIDLTPTNTTYPFQLRRRQFPVKLAFAMSINKSQGQTLDRVGLFLPKPVFSHGQLYVAMSRVRSSAHIAIQVEDSDEHGRRADGVYTRNVVYPEIL